MKKSTKYKENFHIKIESEIKKETQTERKRKRDFLIIPTLYFLLIESLRLYLTSY